MIILIRKRHVAYVVLLCCFVAGLSAVLWHGNAAFTAAFAPGEEGASPVVVVDAGHGGEDGGAVAADGTVESGLNLAIARRVRDLLTFAGVPTTVTREGGRRHLRPRQRHSAGEEGLRPPQPGGSGE